MIKGLLIIAGFIGQMALAQSNDAFMECYKQTSKMPFLPYEVVVQKVLAKQQQSEPQELTRKHYADAISLRLGYVGRRDTFMVFVNPKRWHSEAGAITGNIASLRSGLCACERIETLTADIGKIRKYLLRTVLAEGDDFVPRVIGSEELECPPAE